MRWKVLGGVLTGVCVLQSAIAAGGSYKSLGEIPIGGEGGWDILTIDSPAQRLYQSHAIKVVVIDLAQREVAGEIHGLPGVHAFLAIPELKRGVSTNGKEAKASIVDLPTLQTISQVETGENPDALAYDPRHRAVYVFNHTGNSTTVIDGATAKAVATTPLGGSPEFAVVDEAAGRVYCNIEDKNEVGAIDTRAG